MRKTTLYALVAIALVVIPGTFAIGYRTGFEAAGPTVDVFAGITPQPEVGEEVVEKLRVFWEAWDHVQTNYYQGPLDPRELVEGATRGMVRSTGDPYTDWVDAKSAKIDRERLEGHFEGIGATVELDDEGLLKIVRPLPGSPAEEAGLKANDIVLAVDGRGTKGKTLEELVILVRGPTGTTVVLTIRSEGETESRDVSVVRGEIVIPSVVAKAVDEFGYIRLSNFGAKTTEELRESIRDLRSNGAEGIILDLRNNPGGLLNTAIDVAGEFFPAGTLVVSEKSRTEGDIVFKSSATGTAIDLPVVVLINGGSASASEIVAGAIRDHGRGKLVGQPTFGKGSVQIPYELRDKSVVRITVAIWETPGGSHLTGEGIEPDFLIEQDVTELGGDDDPYLEAARRILRGQECCEGLADAA